MNRVGHMHPSREQLAAFGLGLLSPEEASRVEGHVMACDSCCRVLGSVTDDTLVERLRAGNTPGPDAEFLGLGPLPPELATHARYRIVRVLGTGGMGVVYQAEHRLMERTVALKVIRDDLLRRPNAVQRFQTEVRAAARLAHPNIVTAHDAEQAGNIHFLVMEYVDGVSLYKLVKDRGPLPVAEACEYVRQAALGLQHAFECGMVHRDIKPHNLMRTRHGQVKILDFGLARFAREAESEEASAGASRPMDRLTATDMQLGTPDYMAPEQAQNSRQVDIRSDIYGLGATFYFLLAGRVPYPGGAGMKNLLLQSDFVPPTLPEVRPAVPAALAAVVERMMTKDPAERYQIPGDVALALAPFAEVPSASLVSAAGRTRFSKRRRALAAVGIVAAAALLGWLVFGPSVRSRQQPAPRATGKVLILLPQKYYSQEFFPVRDAIRKEGRRKVVVASSANSPCVPLDDAGPEVQPDLVVTQDLQAADYDAIVFTGGYIWEFKDDNVTGRIVGRLIGDMLAADKPVAALASGQRVLAAHGALKGRKVALNRMVREGTPECGAQWLDQPVVVDGPVITGADRTAAWPFARALLKKLWPD